MSHQSELTGRRRDDRQEFEAQIASTPSSATVKGMYIDAFLCTLDSARVPRPTSQRYIAFKDYPLQDYMRMLLDACGKLHPDCTTRDALRRQGRLVYPTLGNSTVGKIIFAIAGRNWQSALSLASRGWEISIKPGSAKLSEITSNSAILALREVHNFADTFQVGVMEGAMETFLVSGTVVPRRLSRSCDVDLVLKWD